MTAKLKPFGRESKFEGLGAFLLKRCLNGLALDQPRIRKPG